MSFDGSASTDADGSIVSHAWDFGDGQAAAGPTAIHLYSVPGSYAVTLTVTDDGGATATATASIQVAAPPPPPNQPPTASLAVGPLSGDAPLTASFDGSASTDADGSIVSHAWDFGDGQAAAGPTASHVYTVPGSYPLTLTVTDDDGATATASTTIAVAQPVTGYQLLVSLSGDRSNPILLDGATVSGNIYVFTSPDEGVAASRANRVRFWLDDPGRIGSPVQSERLAPYDFAGGSTSLAKPFDANGLAGGSHTITAELPLADGSSVVVSATFTESN